MYCDDVESHLIVYNYDMFHSCFNPRHVKAPAIILISTPFCPYTFSLHHIPHNFFQTPSKLYLSTHPSITPKSFIPLEEITWFSFTSVIFSLGSHLHTWSDDSVTYFTFESSTLHYPISFFLPAYSTLQYTTLPHFYYNLNRLHYSL